MERELSISSYVDTLVGVVVIDEIHPNQVLSLFLDTRKLWISQKLLGIFDDNDSMLVVMLWFQGFVMGFWVVGVLICRGCGPCGRQ